MSVLQVSTTLTSQPAQVTSGLMYFIQPPTFIIEEMFTGNSPEDEIYCDVTNSMTVGNIEEAGRRDLEYFIADIASVYTGDVLVGTTLYSQTCPIYNLIFNTGNVYRGCLLKVSTKPPTDPLTFVGISTILDVTGTTQAMMAAAIGSTGVVIDADTNIYAPVVQHTKQVTVVMVNPMSISGKYTVTVKIYHKKTSALLTTISFSFMYTMSNAPGTGAAFGNIERQTAMVALNPITHQLDRIIVSTDRPLMDVVRAITNIKKKLHLYEMTGIYNSTAVNLEQDIEFETKVI